MLSSSGTIVSRRGPENVGTQVVASDPPAGGGLDGDAVLGRDLLSQLPVADDVGLQADGVSELADATDGFDCLGEGVHARIITHRDYVVNTHRVRRPSRDVNNARMPFHDNLRRLRLAKKLTQEQLALDCGWKGQSRIANYEADPSRKGARKPDLDGVPIIAAALGVSIQELFDPQAATSQSTRPDPDTLASALEALARINEVQVGEQFPLSADNILVAYEEVLRDDRADLDINEIGRRIASRLRGKDGKVERRKSAKAG